MSDEEKCQKCNGVGKVYETRPDQKPRAGVKLKYRTVSFVTCTTCEGTGKKKPAP